MNTCDTCKYWEHHSDMIDDPTWPTKKCLCPKMEDGYEGDDACTSDGEEYGIMTGPKFGCIHYEQN